MEESQPLPRIPPPYGGGRSSGVSNSPEFEFWKVRNPSSFPQPILLSADELFSGGFLLPLNHLNLTNDAPPPRESTEPSGSGRVSEAESSPPESAQLSATSSLSSSKRWRDIFKKNGKKFFDGDGNDHGVKERDNGAAKERRRERKSGGGGGGGGASSAELNINIWPFARSISAGNCRTRPRAAAAAAATRKVSSAPCSRSNSGGDSKSRKWPSSPGRGGVHLGRSSPVWQVRRGGGGGERRSSDTAAGKGRRRVPVAGGSKTRVCMGYRQPFGCIGDEISTAGADARIGGGCGGAGAGVRGNNLFNIRNLFTKKVY